MQIQSHLQWTAPQQPWHISYERYQIAPEIERPSPDSSLLDMFEQSFVQFAQHDAYICQNQYLTYRKLDEMSLQVASYLQQSGGRQGDKIGIMLPNLLQYPIIALGVLRAGMVLVNINPLYTPRELAYQLNDADIKTLFILDSFLPTFQNALLLNSPKDSQEDHSPNLENIIICRAGDMLGKVKGALVNGYVHCLKNRHYRCQKLFLQQSLKNYHYFNHILSIKNPSYQRPQLALTDVALLQYTGGTTGMAKGAMLTHGNIFANLLQMDALVTSAYEDELAHAGAIEPNCLTPIQVDSHQDILLTALPLYHIFAFTICCMFAVYKGNTGLLIPNPRDTKGLVKQLAQHPVSFLIGVNTLFSSLLVQPVFRRLDFSGLKATIGGGMAISPAIAKQWHSITGMPIVEGYGLSETSPVVTFNPLTIAEFTNKIGIPAPSTDIKILNEKDKNVAIGERGEIVVKGPQVMVGYYKRPYETYQALTKQGYFRTGDIGIMDERGFIKIVDRKKDMILVSGFNVYPHEIEDVISQHPDVAECAVIGIPSEIRGEEPKLFVVRNANKVTEEQLLYFGRLQLTGYKRPRSVQFVDSLPKSNVGKILRKELRKMEGLE